MSSIERHLHSKKDALVVPDLREEICALVQYKNFGIQQAADEVIQKRLTALNGSGGVIVASPKGEIAWSFNTPGMYRASMAADRPARISIFKDEP